MTTFFATAPVGILFEVLRIIWQLLEIDHDLIKQ